MALVTPPPRGRVPALNKQWKAIAPSVEHATRCNKGPRVSMAPFLDVVQARRLSVVPYTPGRRPAPRQELWCVPTPAEMPPLIGAYARDLLVARPKGGFNPPPDDSVPFGPPFSPPQPPVGPGPLPPVAPQPPTVSPQPVPPTTPPTTQPLPPGGVPPQSPSLPLPSGVLRTINFNFSGDITAGSATSEVRVYGPISRRFYIREVQIVPIGGFELGQILDIVVSGDSDPLDSAILTGASIFPALSGVAIIPAPDNERGVLLGEQPVKIDLTYFVDQPSQSIKVQTRLAGTALNLPNLHVMITIEEVEVAPVPVVPRPPLIPTVPPSEQPPMTPPVVRPVYLDALYAPRVALWVRVAQSAYGDFGVNAALASSYLAWRENPASSGAALFVATMNATAGAAGVPADPYALVPLNQPVTAG